MEQKKTEREFLKKEVRSAEQKNRGNPPLEDMALKAAAQFFGTELLPVLGIQKKIHLVMPTEVIHLEKRQMYQDFNYETEDGEWLHFEFESDSVKLKDLKRFREYEATTSRTYQVAVITCVVCSSTVKEIRSSFTEGLNTYRVQIIRLKTQNAEQIFDELEKDLRQGRVPQKEKLVAMLLTPLMGGDMPQAERFRRGFRYLKESVPRMEREENSRMQAIFYAFAVKFLNKKELGLIKEELRMTILGEMLKNDGIEEGIEKGIEKGARAMVEMCREFGVSREETVRKVMQKLAVTEQKAERYVGKYWKENED